MTRPLLHPRPWIVSVAILYILALCVLTGGGPVLADAFADKATNATNSATEKLIEQLLAAEASQRTPLLHKLAHSGAEALDATRRALAATSDAELKKSLRRCVAWQVAGKIVPTLKKGLESELTFDGQYDSLRGTEPELVDALLLLVDDEATPAMIRLAACRALADVADATILPRLRALYYDPLLAAALKEQVKILMAVFGDTHPLDREISRLERRTISGNVFNQTSSYLQLANLYYRIRNYDKAVACYDKVIEFYERYYEAARERAKTGKLQVSEMRRISQEIGIQYYNAACSSSLNKDIKKSQELLEKAVRLDPIHFKNMDKDGDLRNLREAPDYSKFKRDLAGSFEEEEL